MARFPFQLDARFFFQLDADVHVHVYDKLDFADK